MGKGVEAHKVSVCAGSKKPLGCFHLESIRLRDFDLGRQAGAGPVAACGGGQARAGGPGSIGTENPLAIGGWDAMGGSVFSMQVLARYLDYFGLAGLWRANRNPPDL